MKKKVLALLLAVTMTLGMSMTAMADETPTPTPNKGYQIVENLKEGTNPNEKCNKLHTITIGNETDGNKVNAYQIFDLDVYDNGDVTVAWGNGISVAGQDVLIKEFATTSDGKTLGAYDVAEAIKLTFDGKEGGPTAEQIDHFTDIVAANKTVALFDSAEITDEGVVSFQLSDGYYLIEEINAAGDAVYSLQYVIANKIVVSKTDDVTSIKKVDDVNDSKGDPQVLQDSADYDIGDHVPFTLVGTLPDYFDTLNADKTEFKYDPYYYEFVDTMDQGLTFSEEEELQVYMVDKDVTDLSKVDPINGWTKIASNYYTLNIYNTPDAEGKTSFSVAFINLHAISGMNSSKRIVVKFTATLNKQAKIGDKGNENKSYIKYTNASHGVSKTPDDTVIVFTYEVIVNKVNEVGNPLAGAKFTLYKKVTTGGKYNFENDQMKAADNGSYIALDDIVNITNEGTTFEFKGIDDGEYVLEESSAPEDYNPMAPISFTVKAEHSNDDGNKPRVLESVSILKKDETADTTFSNVTTEDSQKGIFAKTIENRKGSILPSTGGIGTTIFYIIGGVLVIGAGVVLFTKKKMAKEEN